MGQQKSKVTAIHVLPAKDTRFKSDGPKDSLKVAADSEDLDGQKKVDNDGLKALLKRFAEQTTMHGLARVVSPELHLIWKVLWFVLVLGAGGWTTYNVSLIFRVFSEYPVMTTVDMNYKEQIEFPAVTFCNLNIMRKSKYLQEALLQDIRTDLLKSGFSDENVMLSFSDEVDSQQKLKKFINLVPADLIMDIGHQLDGMVLMCDFMGIPCNFMNFSMFFNFKFGNCFTFAADDTANKVLEAGPSNALKLLLSVEEDEYMPQSPSAGVKMVVHPKTSMPFPDSDGFLLSPGFLTQVGVTKSMYQRTGAPYGDCVDFSGEDNEAVNMYAGGLMNVTYSPEACFSTCYQLNVAESCGCCDPDYPCTLSKVQGTEFDVTLDHTHKSDLNYCDFFDDQTADCVWTIKLADWQKKKKWCAVCRPQCLEEIFSHQVSLAAWPTAPALNGIIGLVEKNIDSLGKNTTVNEDFVKRNIIRLEVFFSQLNVETKHTRPVYDWLLLLSDVGGQVGLWLGFSLMTAVELCQLLFNILQLLFAKLCRTKRGSKH